MEKEKKERPSQKNSIKAYLMAGNSITPLEALKHFGCYRLQARISELRLDDGMDIITEMQDGGISPISGMPIRYAKYRLRPTTQRQ